MTYNNSVFGSNSVFSAQFHSEINGAGEHAIPLNSKGSDRVTGKNILWFEVLQVQKIFFSLIFRKKCGKCMDRFLLKIIPTIPISIVTSAISLSGLNLMKTYV